MSRILKLRLPIIFACCLLNAAPALPADIPFYAFEHKEGSRIDAASKGWHHEYEDNSDYGEIWFFMAQTKEGGVLFASLSITNLGLRTYDGACSVQFYSPDGKTYHLQKEYRRKDISGDGERLDVTIGPNRVWNSGDIYYVDVNEKDLRLSMTFQSKFPAFEFGNGRVFFYKDRSALMGIGFNAPRADVTGTLAVEGRSFNLEGYGYHDHSWTTIKIPTFVKKWYTLRLYDQGISIVLHQIYLTDEFGGGLLRLGMIGMDGRLFATRDFQYEPLKWQKEQKSAFNMPIEFKLFVNAGSYTLSGRVKEEKFLDSIDVLESVSWPVRAVIKACYADPFFLRYLANCEIKVRFDNGEKKSISALGVVETNVYSVRPKVLSAKDVPRGY